MRQFLSPLPTPAHNSVYERAGSASRLENVVRWFRRPSPKEAAHHVVDDACRSWYEPPHCPPPPRDTCYFRSGSPVRPGHLPRANRMKSPYCWLVITCSSLFYEVATSVS